MAGHSSDFTSPADHLLRTTEMEAVVMDLRTKIKDLEAPESPELTDVNEAIDRLFRLTTLRAKTNNGTVDPRAETIYDTLNTSVSASVWGLVDGISKDRIESGRPAMEATFGPDEMRFFSGNASLSQVTWGSYSIDSGIDWVSPIWSASTSLVAMTFGSAAMLAACIDKGSIAAKTFGSAAMINAINGKSLAQLTFGSSTRAASWSSSSNSLVDATFGTTVPSIVTAPLIDQISFLRDRVTSLENRVSALGG